jgi:hypothetical protein
LEFGRRVRNVPDKASLEYFCAAKHLTWNQPAHFERDATEELPFDRSYAPDTHAYYVTVTK